MAKAVVDVGWGVRACMKCRKEFAKQYEYNTICDACQHRQAKLFTLRAVAGSSRRVNSSIGDI